MIIGTWLYFGILVTLSLGEPAPQRKRYDGYQLIQVSPITKRHTQALKSLQNSNLEVDFWTPIVLGHNVDINVAPGSIKEVQKILRDSGISYQSVIGNLQQSIDLEETSMLHANKQNAEILQDSFLCRTLGIGCQDSGSGSGSGSGSNKEITDVVGRFARHNDINQWLRRMAAEHPDIAAVETIGSSYEGREMIMIKLGKDIKTRSFTQPIIWIDAGIHAREWIAPAVAVYTINRMITEYGKERDVTRMLDTFNWYILALANPDGYEFTHVSDRLWRKTRSPQANRCVGVDPNRNFDVDFGGAGTSANPCSGTYPGTRAFSEPETRHIRDTIMNIKDKVKAYLSFHAYSQLLLTPYGYTQTKPKDNKEMMRVAQASMDALRQVHGKIFTVGSPPDLLYVATGGSYDWAKLRAGIKYAYTYELRPARSSRGQSGFILNEQEIIPSANEVWASLDTLSKEIQI